MKKSTTKIDHLFTESRLAIIVLDKGFVYIGHLEIVDATLIIRGGSNIRTWGTTAGLGQLALTGPTTNTVLDKCSTVIAPLHSLVHTMEVDASKWPTVK